MCCENEAECAVPGQFIFSNHAKLAKPLKKLDWRTSIDMLELPLGVVQILGHELLTRPLQAVALHKPNQHRIS
jgi:hypothetical protein